jgi:hypothetical protein
MCFEYSAQGSCSKFLVTDEDDDYKGRHEAVASDDAKDLIL